MLYFKNVFVICFTILSFGIKAQDLSDFDKQTPPPVPDYSLGNSWAALPFRLDAADAIPKHIAPVADSLKDVDVFFIHPTTYSEGDAWNADISNQAINKTVDNKPIKYQASAWNGSCRVYAPRYRQAILKSFFTDKPDGVKALDLAYTDVKAAFQYYLDHYNHGRPIVIASHSQGSRHARRLLKEFFDEKPLKTKLVCAYIVGFPIYESAYTQCKACQDEKQTGCILSWASFKQGFEPDGINTFYKDAICVNPITWRTDSITSDIAQHSGMVLLNFNKIIAHKATAVRHRGILWVKVKYPIIKRLDNLHVADINLFWQNIRDDIRNRVASYWKK